VDEVGGALDGFSSQSGKGEEERMGGSGPVPHGRREMGERERGPGASVVSTRQRNATSNGPRRRARATLLSLNRGGRRGTGDTTRRD
jgi:hypothetical protein